MWTPQSTDPQRQLDTGFKQKLSFSGTSFTMLDLSRSNKKEIEELI
jgi:hypothetical protein